MRYSALKFLIFSAITLFVAPTYSFEGDSKDNGGNLSYRAITREITGIKSVIANFLTAESLMLYTDFKISDHQLKELLKIIDTIPILLSYDQLSVTLKTPNNTDEYMVPVDALNNRHEFYIKINVGSWAALERCDKISLLLHEFFSLGKLDSNLKQETSQHLTKYFRACQKIDYNMPPWFLLREESNLENRVY